MCVHVYVREDVPVRAYVCIIACMCVRTGVYVCARTHVRACLCAPARACVRARVCVCVCVSAGVGCGEVGMDINHREELGCVAPGGDGWAVSAVMSP